MSEYISSLIAEIARLRALLWSVDVNPDTGALDPEGALEHEDD